MLATYLAIKQLHIACAILSGAGFLLQGAWMMAGSPLLNHRATRTVPHVIDTVFLGSAIALVTISGQYPFVVPWVTAKVGALVAYIVLGALALRGRGMTLRIVAFAAALATYAWIVSVALSRNPAGFLHYTGYF